MIFLVVLIYKDISVVIACQVIVVQVELIDLLNLLRKRFLLHSHHFFDLLHDLRLGGYDV